MAETPADPSINRLVQAVRLPFSLLGRGCAAVENDSSSDEEVQGPEESVRNANFVDLHCRSEDVASPLRQTTREEQHGAAMLQALSQSGREE